MVKLKKIGTMKPSTTQRSKHNEALNPGLSNSYRYRLNAGILSYSRGLIMDIDTVLKHYIIAALWSSTDDNGGDLDAIYSEDDLAPETLSSMRTDIQEFVKANVDNLQLSNQSDEQIGHDFWLTRNHHGAGFWDRGLGLIGDKLTKSSHAFGEVYLYVGDDGLIYA